jgi:transcriptional regulator of heat shock response
MRLARGAESELARTLSAIAAAWPEVTPERSATAGLRGLLNEPESRDPDFVRLVIEHIEVPTSAPGTDDGMRIDTDDSVARVRATVHLGDARGLLTLVGPARMRYGPAVRVVHGVSDALRAQERI